MTCEHCHDPVTGDTGYPMYGVGPHTHDMAAGWIGSTRPLAVLPKWPDNFLPDPDAPGLGTWFCPHCRDGMPAPSGTPT